MTKRSTDDFKNMVYSNKEETIKLVAEIILKDIKSMELPSDYPSPSKLCEENNWAPQSLKTFMSYLITCSLKSTSLTQCTVQRVRPRSAIPPIPMATGLAIDYSALVLNG